MSIHELARKAQELHEIRAMISELQKEASSIEDEFKAHMAAADTDTLTAGSFKLTWKIIESQRFDTSAFKEAMPELAARFMKGNVTRRFVIA